MTLQELRDECPDAKWTKCSFGSCQAFNSCTYRMIIRGETKLTTRIEKKKKSKPQKITINGGCFKSSCKHTRSCEIQGQCIYYHIDLQNEKAQQVLRNNLGVKGVLNLLKKHSTRGIKFPIDSAAERERIWAQRNGYSQSK